MCLSTAYRNEKNEDSIIARYVGQLKVEPGAVVLTDVMGAEVRVPGTLSFVDLTGGVVIIKTDAA